MFHQLDTVEMKKCLFCKHPDFNALMPQLTPEKAYGSYLPEEISGYWRFKTPKVELKMMRTSSAKIFCRSTLWLKMPVHLQALRKFHSSRMLWVGNWRQTEEPLAIPPSILPSSSLQLLLFLLPEHNGASALRHHPKGLQLLCKAGRPRQCMHED